MDQTELKNVHSKFKQGLQKLTLLKTCLARLTEKGTAEISVKDISTESGELCFWYAGTRYYIKIRITDRSIENVEPEYKVPIGWLDWGEFDIEFVICNRCNYRAFKYYKNEVQQDEHELEVPKTDKTGKATKVKEKFIYTYVRCINCGAKIVLSDRQSKGEYIMAKFRAH